jgi:protein TonB
MLFLLFAAALAAEPPMPPTSVPPAIIVPPPDTKPTNTAEDAPHWERGPSQQDLRNAIPGRARNFGVSGRAVMSCALDAGGRLQECRIVEEEPAGFGFGRAALSLAAKFKLTRTTPSGTSVAGGHVSIPVRFVAPS